jgi:hypothetical protein
MKRYVEATKALEDAIRIGDKSGRFDFPGLQGEGEHFDDLKFKEKIDTALEEKKSSVEDEGTWEKFTRTAECIFTALTPFAKQFLAIAKEGASVLSFRISNNV